MQLPISAQNIYDIARSNLSHSSGPKPPLAHRLARRGEDHSPSPFLVLNLEDDFALEAYFIEAGQDVETRAKGAIIGSSVLVYQPVGPPLPFGMGWKLLLQAGTVRLQQ